MSKQRNYSTEFKRQVVLEYLAGETLYGLSKRHDDSANIIRLLIARYETDGELNGDTTTTKGRKTGLCKTRKNDCSATSALARIDVNRFG